MAAADIGANFSQYEGNAALGGAAPEVLNINTKPFEDLARYTMLYNKAEYDQRQKNADEMINQLAEEAKININDLRGHDRDEMNKRWIEFQKATSENIRKVPGSPQEKLKLWQEHLSAFRAINNDYLSGKKRSAKYIAELNKIKESTDLNAAEKKLYIEELDRNFDSTKITDDLPSVNIYKAKEFKPPVGENTDLQFIGEEDNANKSIKGTIFISGSAPNTNKANLATNELNELMPDVNSPEFKNLPPAQQDDLKKQIAHMGNAKTYNLMATELNQAISSFVKKDANNNDVFDEDGFLKKYSGTPLMGTYLNLKKMSDNQAMRKAEAISGVFMDKTLGRLRTDMPIKLDPNDFNAGIIDFKNGVTPQQMALGTMFAARGDDKFTVDVQLTDNKIQQIAEQHRYEIDKKQLGLGWFNATKDFMKDDKGNLVKDENGQYMLNPNLVKAGADGANKSGVQSPAIAFGNHINRVKDYLSKNNTNAMTVSLSATDADTKKALGVDPTAEGVVTYTKDGKIIVTIGETKTPVTLEQLKQGFINVAKSGLSTEGTQTEGFVESAENGFKGVYGTNDAKTIWNNWGSQTQEKTTPAPSEPNTTTNQEVKIGNTTYDISSLKVGKFEPVKEVIDALTVTLVNPETKENVGGFMPRNFIKNKDGSITYEIAEYQKDNKGKWVVGPKKVTISSGGAQQSNTVPIPDGATIK